MLPWPCWFLLKLLNCERVGRVVETIWKVWSILTAFIQTGKLCRNQIVAIWTKFLVYQFRLSFQIMARSVRKDKAFFLEFSVPIGLLGSAGTSSWTEIDLGILRRIYQSGPHVYLSVLLAPSVPACMTSDNHRWPSVPGPAISNDISCVWVKEKILMHEQ